MDDNDNKTIRTLIICVTVIIVGAQVWCWHTELEYIKAGYTRQSLPGQDHVQWVKP